MPVEQSPLDLTSETQRATQTVITARRTWKNLREKNEAVWPPLLEIALIQALEKYRPSSRDTRNLRRFPKRNIWISQYILKTTGKQRTAKQVGSRLQQLRDTCEDARILNLLSRKEYSPEPEPVPEYKGSPQWSTSSTSDLSLSPEALSPAPEPTVLQLAEDIISAPAVPSQALLNVNLITSCEQSRSVQAVLPTPPKLEVLTFGFEAQWPSPSSDPASSHQRQITLFSELPLWSQKPVMTFASTTGPLQPLHDYISLFRVFIDGVHVHSEPADVYLLSDNGGWVYGTRFISGYWTELCQNSDLSHCQIAQEIIHLGNPSSVALSVTYNFNSTQTPSTPIPPAATAIGPDDSLALLYAPTPSTPAQWFHQPPTFDTQWEWQAAGTPAMWS